MKYEVLFSERALKQLKKLDKYTQRMIISWIDKNLVGCKNPRQHGKALVGNFKGHWRYRVGDYRLICTIEEEKIIIYVMNIGHRKEIYQ